MMNRTEAMNRLMRKMWTNGWASVMGAEVPFEDMPKPDAVFIKEGSVVIADLVYLPSATSKKRVKDRSDELIQMESRARSGELGYDHEMKVGFVLAKNHMGDFYWEMKKSINVRARDDHETLDEVILQ